MEYKKELFGTLEGKEVNLYTFKNDKNAGFSITNYGGIITHLIVPDKNGVKNDIVLGFDNLDQYVKGHPYFGALIGRFGNRIANGEFILDGVEYKMAQNNDTNHLHGGLKGFDKVIWEVLSIIETKEMVGIELKYVSVDGEEGYPGTMTTTVKCTLNNNNELTFDYFAICDKKTIVNLTHHGYFNLNGMKKEIYNHLFQINADSITPVDNTLIPTGDIKDVSNSPFDFRKACKIGERIELTGGFDHNYVLNKKGSELSLAATVVEDKNGICMEVHTTEPGMQLYTANYLDGSITGKNGIVYNKHFAFCFETQHFPDSPNKPSFPSTILNPGDEYSQKTIYKFGTV